MTALAKDLGHTNIKKRTIKYFMKQLDKNGDNKISFEGNTNINKILIKFLLAEFKAMSLSKLKKK